MKERFFRSPVTFIIVLSVMAFGLYGEMQQQSISGLGDLWWHMFSNKHNITNIEEELLISQFSASAGLVAFPTILDGGSTGLIVFDRASSKTRVIQEERAKLLSPFLSIDGERLLFVRRDADRPRRDIVSCSTDNWRCKVLVRTEGTVFSPTELSKDAIIYSSSPMVIGADQQQRYNRLDIFLASNNETHKLTALGYYDLDSISVTHDSIFFSASNGPYELFRLGLSQAIQGSFEPIRPSVFMGPSSIPIVSLSASFDGQFVSYRKAETVNGKYRYDLNVDRDGVPFGKAKVDGIAISRGTFIQHDLVFNELYSDRYIVKQWDILNNTFVNIAEIQHEPSTLKLLERIPLVTEH